MRPLLFLVSLTFVAWASPSWSQGPPGGTISKIEFRDTTVGEAVRLVAELSGANVFATGEAAQRRLTMVVRNTTVRGAINSIARVTGLSVTYDPEARAYLLVTPQQFANDIVVIREGNTRIFNLRHQNVVSAALIIRNLFGSRVSLNLDTDDPDALVIGDSPIQDSRTVGGDRDNRNSNNSRSTGGGGGSRSSEADDIDLADLSPEQLRRILGLSAEEAIAFEDAAQFLGLEPTIFITVNRDHNLLFVRTADTNVLTSIQKIIAASDRPTRQVLLEMKVLALDLDDEFRSIFNFGLSGDEGSVTSARGETTTGRTGIELGNFPLTNTGTLFFQLINDNLLAQIELLESANRVRTIATPLLVAANNTPAELFVGDEVVLTRGFESESITNETSTTTTNTTQIEIRDVGQTLEIIPRINSDNTVTLVIRQEASTVVQGGGSIPLLDDVGDVQAIDIDTVNTARVAGTVTALDGTTIAFGGLINDVQARTRDQVPILGDIPILGTAFSGDVDDDSRSELVILITPHLYSTGIEGEAITRARLANLSQNQDVDRAGFSASDDRTPSVNTPGQQQSYMALTRYAAARAHGVLPPNNAVYRDIVPTEVIAGAPLVFGTSANVLAEPVAIWRKGGVYVTTVLLENTADTVATLDPLQLRGDWLAATLESDVLAPRGQVGSRNYLYLLSNRPYEEVLLNTGLGGAL